MGAKLRRRLYSTSVAAYYVSYILTVLITIWFSWQVSYVLLAMYLGALLCNWVFIPAFVMMMYPSKL